jgi:hypothetical protein
VTDLDHKDKEEDDDKTLAVTKYFTMPVSGKKQSLWWEGFELFVPSQHPNLYSEHVMCLACSKSRSLMLAIVKIGSSHSKAIFELTRGPTILKNMMPSPSMSI